MTINQYLASLAKDSPPKGISPYLKALWLERRGDWKQAHEIVQEIDDSTAAWLHAYIHRREGDQNNAAYWYAQANKPVSQATLDDEWTEIVEALL